MDKAKKQDEGIVDDIDFDPEFHDMEEDFNLEQMKKTNPKLYELMKRNGAELDEDNEEHDEDEEEEDAD
jgi:hypothetical protein